MYGIGNGSLVGLPEPRTRKFLTGVNNKEIDLFADSSTARQATYAFRLTAQAFNELRVFDKYRYTNWLDDRPTEYVDDYNGFQGNQIETMAKFLSESGRPINIQSLIDFETDSLAVVEAKRNAIRLGIQSAEGRYRVLTDELRITKVVDKYLPTIRTNRYTSDSSVIKRDELGLSAQVCRMLLSDIEITPRGKLVDIADMELVNHYKEGEEDIEEVETLEAVVNVVSYWVAKGKLDGALLGNKHGIVFYKANQTTTTNNLWVDGFDTKPQEYQDAFNLALKLRDIEAISQDATDDEKTLHMILPVLIGSSAGSQGVTYENITDLATTDPDELLGACVLPQKTYDDIKEAIGTAPSQDFIDGFADSFKMQIQQGVISGYASGGVLSPLEAKRAPYIGGFADAYYDEYRLAFNALRDGNTPKTVEDIIEEYQVPDKVEVGDGLNITINIQPVEKITPTYYTGLRDWLTNPTISGFDFINGSDSPVVTFDSPIGNDVGLGTGSRSLTEHMINKGLSVVYKLATRWNEAINEHYYITHTFPNGISDLGLTDVLVEEQEHTWTSETGYCEDPTYEQATTTTGGACWFSSYYTGPADENYFGGCCVYTPPSTHTTIIPAITRSKILLTVNSNSCVSSAGKSKTVHPSYARGYLLVMENTLRFANLHSLNTVVEDMTKGILNNRYKELAVFKSTGMYTGGSTPIEEYDYLGYIKTHIKAILDNDEEFEKNEDEYLSGIMQALEFIYLNMYVTLGYSLTRNSIVSPKEYVKLSRERAGVRDTIKANMDLLREAVAVKGCEIDTTKLVPYKPTILDTVAKGSLYGKSVANFIKPVIDMLRPDEVVYSAVYGNTDTDEVLNYVRESDIFTTRTGYMSIGNMDESLIVDGLIANSKIDIINKSAKQSAQSNKHLIFDKSIYASDIEGMAGAEEYVSGTKTIESALVNIFGIELEDGESEIARALEFVLPYIRDGYSDGSTLYAFDKYTYSDINLPHNIARQGYAKFTDSYGKVFGFDTEGTVSGLAVTTCPMTADKATYAMTNIGVTLTSPSNSWVTTAGNVDLYCEDAMSGTSPQDTDVFGFGYSPRDITATIDKTDIKYKIFTLVKKWAYRLGYASAYSKRFMNSTFTNHTFTSVQLGDKEVARAVYDEITKVVTKTHITKTMTGLSFDTDIIDNVADALEEDHTPAINENTSEVYYSNSLSKIPFAYYARGKFIGCYLGYYGGYIVGSVIGNVAHKDFNEDIGIGIQAVLLHKDKFEDVVKAGIEDSVKGTLEIKGVLKDGEELLGNIDTLFGSDFDPDEELFDTSLPSDVTATGTVQADVDKGIRYGKWLLYATSFMLDLKDNKQLSNTNGSFKIGFDSSFDTMYDVGFGKGRKYLPKDWYDIFDNCKYDLPFSMVDNGVLRLMVRIS